jgi:pyruvate,water dikinase
MVSAAQVGTRVNVVDLRDPGAREHELSGGKGANLGHLVAAGFQVPGGFVVTTEAYSTFLTDSGVEAQILGLLAEIDYDSVDSLEKKTEQIRELLAGADVPASLSTAIRDAYQRLGSDHYVAVRSSGTAEDLEGASFAGLHDTYLDVLGGEELLASIKRCWASLWTARATGYRERNGFDHFEARLAVVVQEMVESEVSGVMFMANPRSGATDETVINASWGLGEAVVQGIVTPDEYTVKSGMLNIDGEIVVGSQHVLERTIGSKEKQYVRNPETGQGTVIEEVPLAKRSVSAMSDEHITQLAAIGRRVTAHYAEYPQDIEWALANDTLYLLQSRPITGVNFSWDNDINHGFRITTDNYPPEIPFAVRTRAMADEGWTGGITPLMFSWRGNLWNTCFWEAATRIGRPDLRDRTPMVYHKGYAYWDCGFDKGLMLESALPMSRSFSLERLPDDFKQDLDDIRFGAFDWVKQLVRATVNRPDLGLYSWLNKLKDYIDNPAQHKRADGVSDSQLPLFTDGELVAYLDHQIMFEDEYNKDIGVVGFFMRCRDAMAALAEIVNRWYTGDNVDAFTHLVTGTPERTWTLKEHIALWEMTNHIRGDRKLREAFDKHPGREFFDHIKDLDSATDFRAAVDAFLQMSGHRGHPDRDIIYTRYADDPGMIYSALVSHLKSDENPLEQEHRNNELRNAAHDDVLANLRRGPLGFAKAEAFKLVHDYVLQFLTCRDNERWVIDRNTYSIRKALLELNRRMMERNLFETDDDFWFLTIDELVEYNKNPQGNPKLVRWKIEGRRRNYELWERKEVSMPKFLERNQARQTETRAVFVDDEGRTVFHGSGTSSGEVTATARVIRSLSDVGRVNKGDILITNSTDPGWTPIFAALSGVIVETGGLMSHSGCLAREYGFPAAHVEDTVAQIPDGATITLNGSEGWVRIENDGAPTGDGTESAESLADTAA